MSVSLVIPGRNAKATLRACLDSVVPALESGALAEILYVDDGSTDASVEIARSYPIRVLDGEPAGGPGAARNRGWRACRGELVWFIDSDCVARPDALAALLARLDDPRLAGVGGSYDNQIDDAERGAWLARVVHAEIVARHRAMPATVDFLGSFNVLYRRSALESVGGFDEHWITAEDAELAYRLHSSGYRLAFDRESRVGHHHPTSLARYLRAQAQHGYWRVQLYARHPRRSTGDAYSGALDHLQPPLAMLAIATAPGLLLSGWRWLSPLLLLLLALAHLPRTAELIRQARDRRLWVFAPLGVVRAFARGLGLTVGVLALAVRRPPRLAPRADESG